MKKILVISALALIPSFLYADMSSTAPLSMNMYIPVSLSISAPIGMRFPTQVQGMVPSPLVSTGSSPVSGGASGSDGKLVVTGDGNHDFVLTVVQATMLTNGGSQYNISYSALNGDNWNNIYLVNGYKEVWVRGTVNSTTPVVAGSYQGTATCTVHYN